MHTFWHTGVFYPFKGNYDVIINDNDHLMERWYLKWLLLGKLSTPRLPCGLNPSSKWERGKLWQDGRTKMLSKYMSLPHWCCLAIWQPHSYYDNHTLQRGVYIWARRLFPHSAVCHCVKRYHKMSESVAKPQHWFNLCCCTSLCRQTTPPQHMSCLTMLMRTLIATKCIL